MVSRINDKTAAALKKLQEEQEAEDVFANTQAVSYEEMAERAKIANDYLDNQKRDILASTKKGLVSDEV